MGNDDDYDNGNNGDQVHDNYDDDDNLVDDHTAHQEGEADCDEMTVTIIKRIRMMLRRRRRRKRSVLTIMMIIVMKAGIEPQVFRSSPVSLKRDCPHRIFFSQTGTASLA